MGSVTDDEMVRTTVTMPRHLRDAAKRNTEHGELSEAVRERYREIAYGEEIAKNERKKQELAEVRQEKDRLREQLTEIQAKLENVERKERRLEEQVEESRAIEQEYETILETLEAEVRDGAHITTKRTSVKNAAEIKGCEPEAVVQELKDRNPEIPDCAFKPPRESDEDWFGL